ncbi:unnamed protein product [Ostreobium quekettii]|uniref:Uncharacterized protein n=1 Tax=Ostreobium quekettii TaxID=121088 RepID=A0A8S1ITR2_9CHLO|nr:unnamed protein product [Ostreobium quekettii]
MAYVQASRFCVHIGMQGNVCFCPCSPALSKTLLSLHYHRQTFLTISDLMDSGLCVCQALDFNQQIVGTALLEKRRKLTAASLPSYVNFHDDDAMKIFMTMTNRSMRFWLDRNLGYEQRAAVALAMTTALRKQKKLPASNPSSCVPKPCDACWPRG